MYNPPQKNTGLFCAFASTVVSSHRCLIYYFIKNGLCDMSHVGNSMKYGYVTRDNDFGIQENALRGSGCDKIFDDRKITQVIRGLCPGDVVVVWRMDKLASTVSALKNVMNEIHGAGATVLSLQEQFDSGVASKELLDRIMDVIAAAEK